MTTQVPPITFTTTGPQAPSEAAILTGVEADLNAAFGGNLNFALNTPQGQIASTEAAVIGQTNNEFLFLSNMFDPAYSYGRWQDAIARIYFLYRNAAQVTLVTCTCSGAAGVVIPQGALAQDTAGNVYTCVTGGTITGLGTVSLSFANVIPGPTPCPAGTLTTIVQAIAGWDSITNPAAGTVGVLAETRAAFEARRQDSIEANSQGAIGSILGAVAKVQNVTDYYGYDNSTNSPATILGVTIPANSIYIAVEGGTNANVAFAIWSKKGPGCAYYGNTTVNVTDPNPLYQNPPVYSVTFERPPSLAIVFLVNIVTGPNVPSDAATQIQTAMLNLFNGEVPNEPRARIASLLLASTYATAIQSVGPWALVRSVLMGSANSSNAITASVSGAVLTVTAVTTTTLAVGQTIEGAGINPGTQIASLGSGTGGTGTYNLNQTYGTIGSESMVAINPTLTYLQVQANQSPTLSAADITVTAS